MVSEKINFFISENDSEQVREDFYLLNYLHISKRINLVDESFLFKFFIFIARACILFLCTLLALGYMGFLSGYEFGVEELKENYILFSLVFLSLLFSLFANKVKMFFLLVGDKIAKKKSVLNRAKLLDNVLDLKACELEYELKHKCIECYIEYDGKRSKFWSEKAKGYAIQSESVTLLFESFFSNTPNVVILHPGNKKEIISSFLKKYGVKCSDLFISEKSPKIS